MSNEKDYLKEYVKLIFDTIILSLKHIYYHKKKYAILILGIIIAPIIMALVYFAILTPVSLVVRVFGKDLLGLKFMNKQQTYWINRKNRM